MSGLNEDEERELSALIEELQLSDFERRRRRLKAAQARLQAAADLETAMGRSPRSIFDALHKARMGEPLSDDEFILVNFGFTREDILNREPEKELERRGLKR